MIGENVDEYQSLRKELFDRHWVCYNLENVCDQKQGIVINSNSSSIRTINEKDQYK